jgi:hypothetical protein
MERNLRPVDSLLGKSAKKGTDRIDQEQFHVWYSSGTWSPVYMTRRPLPGGRRDCTVATPCLKRFPSAAPSLIDCAVRTGSVRVWREARPRRPGMDRR